MQGKRKQKNRDENRGPIKTQEKETKNRDEHRGPIKTQEYK